MENGFDAETAISMADGQYVNIEEVYIGDEVLSYDFSSKSFKASKVTKVESVEKAEVVKLITSKADELVCSAGVRVMMPDGSAKEAKDVIAGEIVLGEDGKEEKIINVSKAVAKAALIGISVEAGTLVANDVVVLSE